MLNNVQPPLSSWDEIITVLGRIEAMNPRWQIRKEHTTKELFYISPENINVRLQLSEYSHDKKKCSVDIYQVSGPRNETVTIYSRIFDEKDNQPNSKYVERYIEQKITNLEQPESERHRKEYLLRKQQATAEETMKEPFRQDVRNQFWGNSGTQQIPQPIQQSAQDIEASTFKDRLYRQPSPEAIRQMEFLSSVQEDLNRLALYAYWIQQRTGKGWTESLSDYSGLKIGGTERSFYIHRNFKKWRIDIEFQGGVRSKSHFAVHSLTESEMDKLLKWVLQEPQKSFNKIFRIGFVIFLILLCVGLIAYTLITGK